MKKKNVVFEWFEVILENGKTELIYATNLLNARWLAKDLFGDEWVAVTNV